jgi:GPH family glycoside/pentoside/hexuronide:cation symporter
MPFLLGASLPLAAVCFLLFVDGVYVGPLAVRIAVLAVLLGLYYLLFTVYAVPFNSLVADLGRAGQDRVRLSSSAAVFNLIGTAGAAVAAGLLIEAFSGAAATGGAGGAAAAASVADATAAGATSTAAASGAGAAGFDSSGFPSAMGILMAIAAVTFLATPLALWRVRSHGAAPSRLTLFQSMRSALQNRPFRTYLIGVNTFWGGFIMINVSVPYYVTVLMGQDEGFTSVALGASLGTALLLFPLVYRAAGRLGNKVTVIASAAVMALALALIPVIPAAGELATLVGVTVMVIAGVGLSGLLVLPNAMIADLSDFRLPDGTKPGEAIYYGLQGLVQKGAIGLVTLASGVLFDVFGNSPDAPLGIILTGPIGAVFAVASVFIMLRYPADRGGVFAGSDAAASAGALGETDDAP